jgi:acetyl-CoA carboxylase carboxyltransferase component
MLDRVRSITRLWTKLDALDTDRSFSMMRRRLPGRRGHGMSWQQEVDEIRRRRLQALEMGGVQRVERQHAQGKLTARERLDLLLDRGSWSELGLLANHQSQRPEMQDVRTPADGFILGYGRIDGREVLVGAEDFTVMGGSVGTSGLLKRERLLELGHQTKVPVVWLFDGSGARASEYVRAGWVGGPHFATMSRLSGIVPQVVGVMGPCAGDPALMAPLADFVVMVRGTSMMAAGGPPVVEAAIGERVSKEELGGSSVHCYVSGVADNEADDDQHCLRLIRDYLAYFPTNVWALPPRVETGDDPERRDEELLAIVPRDRKRPYDMQRVLRHLVDRDSIFEIKPTYCRSVITCLARMDGEVVGVVASQPLHLAGMIDGPAADKMAHFIQLCDAFHVPLVFLSDVPGFMTGKVSEREGTLRRGLRIAYALAWSTVPKVSVVLRKAYGMGAVAMCGHRGGQVLTLVWPSGEFGALPVGGGVSAGHRAAIESADDPEGKRAALEDYYHQFGGAFSTAETFGFDDLIDPRDTRPLIIRALRAARAGRAATPLGPKLRHGITP